MSENMNPNPNPDANNGTPGGNNGEEQKNNGKPEFFLVRWGKAAGKKIGEGIKVVKDHPVAIGISSFLGIVGGGYATYKIMTHGAEDAIPVQPMVQPMIPEPEPKDDEEASTNQVEYVDIPTNEPAE